MSAKILSPDRPHTLPYNAALDGLRDVAVAGVIGSHFGVPLLDHGGNGVDLFFVLSGFLITCVLLDAAPQQALSEFYWNRWTRLLPALALVCLAVVVAGWLWSDVGQSVRDAAASLTYVANWTRAYDVGTPQVLAQAWSLSLEEQFYILYPPMLLLVASRLSRGAIAILLLAVVGLVALHRGMLDPDASGADRVYNGLDTHADGLALGAALAAVLPHLRWNRAIATLARCDVVALLAVPILFAFVPWPRAVVATNVAAAWLILGASCPRTTGAAAILRLTPFVLLGRISYGLYLWHYPVQQYLANTALLSSRETLWIGLPLSIGLATFSYLLVEMPILRWRRGVAEATRQRLGIVGVAATGLAMAAGLAYFLGPLIEQSGSSPGFAITGYAPHASAVGQGFNVQPGGLSVVWLETTASPPKALSARWEGRPLPIYAQARRVAIFVPRAFTETSGHKTIDVTDERRTIALDIDIFTRR